jgi:hypothetical protein
MTKMIQIRNVPEELHRRLKARAALAAMTLSEYLLTEIKLVGERPTLAELRRHAISRIDPSEVPLPPIIQLGDRRR